MAREPFVWGRGGRKMTPDQVDRDRLIAQALLTQASDTSPVGHWTAALNRGLQGWLGGRQVFNARQAEDMGIEGADAKMQNPIIQALMGGVAMPQSAGAGGVSQALAGGASADGGLPASIVQSESGGNWNALNSEGYGGRGQFGEARLADAARAGVIPAGMTGQMYSQASPEVQLAVENWHKQDILGNLGQYVGMDVDGPGPIPPLTEDSLLAVAHLGGTGGARKFIESGGQYNPSDSNGTSLADYAMRHAGGGGMSAQGQPIPVTGGGQDVIGALMGAYADPWVRQQYGDVLQPIIQQQIGRANAQFERQLAQADPMYQAQLAQLTAPAQSPTAEREAFAAAGGLQPGTPEYANYILTGQLPDGPDNPSSVREYEFYSQQAAARGEAPMPYEQFITLSAKAGNPAGVVQPQLLGTQGLVAIPDPNVPQGYRVEPAPGSPIANEQDQAARANERRLGNRTTESDIVTTAAQRAREAAEGRMVGGVLGRAAAINPESTNAELYRQVDVLRSQAQLGNLQAMRESSPTGGALGSVTEGELKILADKSGALDPASPNFLRDLDDYERTLLRTIHGPDAGDQIFMQSRSGVAMDFENMAPADILAVDVMSLTPDQFDAYEEALKRLQR